MEKVEFRVIDEDGKVVIHFPETCSDFVMHWKDGFDLGNMIGHTADQLPMVVNNPNDDQAEAANCKVTIYREQYIVVQFVKCKSIAWKKHAALIVAKRICDACQTAHVALHQKKVADRRRQ